MSAANSRVRAVLFDLDGTLVDTAPDLVGCVQDVMRARGARPLPFKTLRHYVSRGMRGLLTAAYGADFIDSEQYPGVLEHCLKLYSGRLAEQSRLFPGMRRVLDRLAAQRIPWGVVTNKPEYLTRPLLEALDLARECAVTVGGGTTTHTKPHPEPMLYAARRLALDTANCIMLGDDPRDMQAAAAAGMTGLAAAWGYFPPDEDINAWGAAAILETPEDLLTWLAGRGIPADPTPAASRAA
ncbi:MAG: HAD-IA family hydrolase [Gammaproteobacteria bacterium]|nr:HAD-IA family hydrolase [Gammaproteobacteria bacterium]